MVHQPINLWVVGHGWASSYPWAHAPLPSVWTGMLFRNPNSMLSDNPFTLAFWWLMFAGKSFWYFDRLSSTILYKDNHKLETTAYSCSNLTPMQWKILLAVFSNSGGPTAWPTWQATQVRQAWHQMIRYVCSHARPLSTFASWNCTSKSHCKPLEVLFWLQSTRQLSVSCPSLRVQHFVYCELAVNEDNLLWNHFPIIGWLLCVLLSYICPPRSLWCVSPPRL